MAERVLIQHEGELWDPWEAGRAWRGSWDSITEGEAARRRQIVTEGTILVDGERAAPVRARVEKARILRTFDHVPSVYDPSDEGPVRAYVPGLWNHGTIPMLGGPPKVGKSSFVSQLVASLVIPDRRFLDHFGPVEMNENEAKRHVWLINAENPPAALHEELIRLGLEYEHAAEAPFYFHPEGKNSLFVDHLDALGGADVFDLSREEQHDLWEYRLLDVAGPPLTVIADGVTAMLNADTTRYGRWFAGFRKLLKALDIPNGLAVGHSGLMTGHLMQGVESMAGPDGLWRYEAREPDRYPKARRTFGFSARFYGPEMDDTTVTQDDQRMLRLVTSQERSKPVSGNDASRRERLIARLREAGSVGILATPLTGSGADGQENRVELDRMRAEHLAISKTVTEGRARSRRWWLTEFAPE